MGAGTATGSRRQGRRWRLRGPLAIAAALAPALAGCAGHHATATATTKATASGSAGTSPARTGPAGRYGVPRYYVVLADNSRHPPSGEPAGEVIEVRATATGQLTDDFPLTLQLHSEMYDPFATLAAAADQRTFFVSHPEDFNSATQSKPVVTDVYRFRLSRAGRITGFTRVTRGYGYADGEFTMAAAPDGQRIAMVDPAAGKGGGISVADLATGQNRVWTGSAPDVETQTPGCCGLLAWEPDNRTLILTQGTNTDPTLELRTLDTRGPGRSLAASQQLSTLLQATLPGNLSGTILSPDGRTITGLVVFSPNSHGEQAPGRDEIVDFSAATGDQTKVLFSQPSHSSIGGGPDFGDLIASDGQGHLLQGGLLGGGLSGTKYVVNWFDGHRFHPLTLDLRSGSTLTGFAW